MDTRLVAPCLFHFSVSLFVFSQDLTILFLVFNMLFLCMQILYLDSLDVGDIVNKDLEVRAAAWTGQLVSKVCLMDKVSET